MKIGIYSITHTETGRCYVGQSSSLGTRWLWHKAALRRRAHPNTMLQRTWDKYGPECFEFVVLEHVTSTSDLCDREQHWMDTLKPVYNSAPAAGTTRGLKHPPRDQSFKERMRALKTGTKHHPETIEKLRLIAAASEYKLPTESRAKISAKLQGRTFTPEHREKLRQALLGRKLPQEHIDKVIAANTGKKRTAEQREKFSKAQQQAALRRKLLQTQEAKSDATSNPG